MYKRNKVKFLLTSKAKRLPGWKELKLEQERIAFARKLRGLQEQCGN